MIAKLQFIPGCLLYLIFERSRCSFPLCCVREKSIFYVFTVFMVYKLNVNSFCQLCFASLKKLYAVLASMNTFCFIKTAQLLFTIVKKIALPVQEGTVFWS